MNPWANAFGSAFGSGYNRKAGTPGATASASVPSPPPKAGTNAWSSHAGRPAGGEFHPPPSIAGGGASPTPPAPPAYGSQSGPGILENWFNQRASGSDPGYEYAVGRGLKDLNTASAARGMFNSGAAAQQSSDYLANMGAQREAQLDSLAGGASGEHQGRLNSMFNQGMALAGGQAGLAGQYDLGAANAMSSADVAQVMMMLNKAGVDSQAQQGLINNIFAGAKAFGGGG